MIAGLRRYLAAKQLGWKSIPATTIGVAKSDIYRLGIVENLQRLELSREQKAKCYKSLLENYPDKYPNQKELAKALGISEAKLSKDLGTIGEQKKYKKSIKKSIDALKSVTLSQLGKDVVIGFKVSIPKSGAVNPKREIKKLLARIDKKSLKDLVNSRTKKWSK